MRRNFDDKYDRDSRYDDDYIEGMPQDNDDIDESEDVSSSENSSVFKKFIRRFFLIILILLLIMGLVVFAMYLSIPDKTNFLIMATDKEGSRTDTIMLVNFDKRDDSFSILAVPRDTYVTVSDSLYNQMLLEYPQPSSKSMKINAVHHFAGNKEGPEALKATVEELLDIKIDYYAKIDIEAFKYIVDTIGGVDFYVPRNMVYSDPYQNLYINLKEGQQLLNGEQAEQVVRYRSGYANADLGRIEVQQNFMKAFFVQALSKKAMLSHPLMYFNALYDYVKTDVGIFDVLTYAIAVGGADVSDIETDVLPGRSGYSGGQSVYLPYENDLQELTEKYK